MNEEKTIMQDGKYIEELRIALKEAYDKINKAIEYITSEETINMFSSINAREKWLKINNNLLNILEGNDKEGE